MTGPRRPLVPGTGIRSSRPHPSRRDEWGTRRARPALLGRVPIMELEAGDKEKVDNFARVVRTVHDDGSTARRTRHKVGMVHIQTAPVSHVNSVRPKRLCVLNPLKLFHIHHETPRLLPVVCTQPRINKDVIAHDPRGQVGCGDVQTSRRRHVGTEEATEPRSDEGNGGDSGRARPALRFA